MRKGIADLDGGVSLIDGLPSVYRSETFCPKREVEVRGELVEESFIEGMVNGFDAVLAPAHVVVRDLDAYFDPAICPTDYLEWLGSWLGVRLNARWPMQRRRALLARAVEIHRMRGTVWGVARAVELYTGAEPEIEDSGGCVASGNPSAAAPGNGDAFLRVTVRRSGNDIDPEVIDRIVAGAKPAHVRHEVRVVDG